MKFNIWYKKHKQILNLCFQLLIKWISNNDLTLVSTINNLYINFIILIYNEYYLKTNIKQNKINPEEYEYFETLFESDIVDLFIDFKDISYNNNSDLFSNQCSSFNILNFIENNVNINIDEISNNINDINEIYDEFSNY